MSTDPETPCTFLPSREHDANAANRVPPVEGRGALLARGGEALRRRSSNDDDVGPEDEVVEHGDVEEVAAAAAAATTAAKQQQWRRCSRSAGLSEQQGRSSSRIA